MFTNAIGQAGQLAIAMTGVGSAMQVMSNLADTFRKEFDAFKARTEASKATQLSYADASRRMGLVLGGDMSQAEADKQIMGFAGRSGIKANQLAIAAEMAMAGKGDLTSQQGLNAVFAMGRMRPDMDGTQLGLGANAIETIQKEFPNATAEQAAAGVGNMYRAARTSNLDALTANLLPGVIKAHALFGGRDSFEEIGGWVAGMGLRAEDREGSVTSTNSINLAAQLKLRVAEANPKMKDASFSEIKQFLRNTPEGKAIVVDMLGSLSGGSGGSEDAIEEFGGKYKLKGRAAMMLPNVEFMQSLQGKDTRTAQLIRNAQTDIGGLNDAGVAAMKTRTDAVNSTYIQGTANLERANTAETEAAQLADTFEARKLQVKNKITELTQREYGVSVAWGITGRGGLASQDINAAPDDEALADAAIKAYAGFMPRREGERTRVKGAFGESESVYHQTDHERDLERQISELIISINNLMKHGQKFEIHGGGDTARGIISAVQAGEEE